MRQWNDQSIRALPLPDRGSKKLFDPNFPGFGVRLTAKSKTFIVQYGKKRQVRVIGRYPEISLKDARKEASAILDDPKPKKRSMDRFELQEAFLDHCQTVLRASTTRRYRAALKKTVPKSPQEIAAFKAMYNWGVRMAFVDENPYRHHQAKFPVRERLLSDGEISTLLKYTDGTFGDILKLLIYTGQRRGQFGSFDTSWIQDGAVHFPSSIMKSRRPHTLPLTKTTLQVASNLQSFNGWGKSKARLDTVTNINNWVLHDIRRYFSTTMAKIGVPLHITEHILDHRSSTSGVQAIYMQYGFLPEMRDALDSYEKHLHSIVH